MAEPDGRELVLEHGPHAVVAAMFGFMVWVRTMPRERVITDSAVYFSGNDPWYHARMVNYIVRYFPASPNFDPFSYFPYGTGRHSGFGGLFDQLIALGALLVGGGSPDTHLIEVVTAYAPPVFGAVTVIPVYLIAKRLMGRWWALLPAGFLALVNGQFLTRTIIGVSDHQSAEAFFGTLAVFGFLYGVQMAYLEQPTRADIEDRNWPILRRPAIAGVLGGLAIASYLMMWGPGVFLVFTMGVFVVIQLARDHVRGEPTEYLAFGTAVPMLVATVLTLAYAKSYDLSATAFSLLQPLVLFSIASGAIVMWGLSEQFRDRDIEARRYPLAVGALIAGSLLISALLVPEVVDKLESLLVRIYSFGLLTSPTSLTVAEIAPATLSGAWEVYAGFFPLAAIGFLLLVYRVFQEDRPVELLVVLWSFTITSAYFTMIRFGYYMGVVVAVLAGFAIWRISLFADLDTIREVSDIETYQLLVVLILLIAVVPGNVIAVGGLTQPVWGTAESLGGANTAWQQELTWVRGNTPEVPLEYYGNYEPPADGDFDYPEGAYGVMSWWDYGHWITYTGHRIPDANPFQQGPRPASAFLLAQNETRANLILEALPSAEARREIPNMTIPELRSTVASQTETQAHEDTRYVMIDDQMAAGKFGAIATWTGPDPSSYFSRQSFRIGNTTAQLVGPDKQYDRTMLARLYFDDANGLSHYRLVHETGQSAIVSIARQGPNGWTGDLNGDGRGPDFVNRRLSSAVYNAVQQNPNLAFYDVRQPATVKTFERVPGATLTGQVNTTNATTIFATVRLRTNQNRTFRYVQTVRTDDDGRFEMTVPYATTNTVGPSEGGTDSGVVALGKYQLFAGNPLSPTHQANTSVPEPAIYDGATISVDLEPIARGNETEASNGSNSSALGLPMRSTAASSLDAPGSFGWSNGVTPTAAEPRQSLDA